MSSALSIVIPALNEAQTLPYLLDDLANQDLSLEVLVVDGGSTDGSQAIALDRGAQLIDSERGRGRQMNLGAKCCRAPTLLFLHADTRLACRRQLSRALAKYRAESARYENLAGHFPLKFERGQGGRAAMYRFMEAKTRSGRYGTINGDQGLLIDQAYFRRLGEFDERLPFFEDQRIAAKIFHSGRWLLLPDAITTSARRFESEGPIRRYALMCLMMVMHDAGFEDFLEELPGLYAEQANTRELRLRPFIRDARRRVFSALRRDPRLLRQIGRFVRGNIWQLALILDLMDERDPPLLKLYEQGLEPHLENALVDTASALIGAGALLGLWPIAERIRFRT